MVRASLFAAALASMLATPLSAQTADFKPVTREMLANPPPGDWLMLNRTYDEQRFSPLKEINRDTVAGLQLAWARGMAAGTNESIPIVYQGVMYVVSPGAGRRHQRRSDLGLFTRVSQRDDGLHRCAHVCAAEGARDLRGHDLLREPRWFPG